MFAFQIPFVGPLCVSGAHNVCVVINQVAENIFWGEFQHIDQIG